MVEDRHRVRQWLGFLILAGGATWHLLQGARVEVDDAYIVLRTAENVAAGHGLVFTPGDAFMPVTCPLWTLLLGAARMLSPTGDLVEIARRTSICFTFAAAVLWFALLRRPLGWFALALGPLLLFAKEVPEHAGNEIGMATFFAAATILAACHRKMTLAAASAGLFYLTRGEGVLLAGLVFAPGVWSAFRRRDLRSHLRTLLVPAIVFGTIVAAWHTYHLVRFGSVFPKTLTVKMLQGHRWPKFKHRLLVNLWGYFKFGAMLATPFALGLLPLLRVVWLLPAWAALHLTVYSALRVPNYDWYYYPLFVLVPVAILAGIAAVSRWTAERFRAKWPLYVGAAATAATLVVWTPTAVPTANGERVIQYQAVAAWLNANAASTPRPLVLASEIGIIGYYARSFPFIDPPGILVPDLTLELLLDWRELVRRHHPGILIFVEDLGDRVCVVDTAKNVEHHYELAAVMPAPNSAQHIYRKVP
jgi:hypothetical protein